MAYDLLKTRFSGKEGQADLGSGRVSTKLVEEFEGLSFEVLV